MIIERADIKSEKAGVFKTCPYCGRVWSSRQEFLADRQITPCGYMVNFEALELGLFLFNHLACRTTLAIKASVFTDLYEGPIYEERATGSEACPGYCLLQDELRPCPARCECSYIRSLLDQIVSWPKEGSDA